MEAQRKRSAASLRLWCTGVAKHPVFLRPPTTTAAADSHAADPELMHVAFHCCNRRTAAAAPRAELLAQPGTIRQALQHLLDYCCMLALLPLLLLLLPLLLQPLPTRSYRSPASSQVVLATLHLTWLLLHADAVTSALLLLPPLPLPTRFWHSLAP
jgi:hypothetical protein